MGSFHKILEIGNICSFGETKKCLVLNEDGEKEEIWIPTAEIDLIKQLDLLEAELKEKNSNFNISFLKEEIKYWGEHMRSTGYQEGHE